MNAHESLPLVAVEDIVDRLTNGYVGPTRDIYHESGVPYLLARHVKNNQVRFDGKTFVTSRFNEKHAKSILKANDLLVVQSGHIGATAVVPSAHEGHNCHAMIVITPKHNRVNARYLSHYFNSSLGKAAFQRIQTGATLKHLNCRDVRQVKIPLPPLSDQKRIADILDKADAVRQKRQDAIDDLSSYVPSLFGELFGEPDAWTEKWPVVPVSDFVVSLEGGKNIKADDKPSDETRYMILKVSAVTWGKYQPHESKPVPPSFEPPSHYFVREGDLLMSRANTRELIGAAVYVDETPDNVILPDKIWRFVWKDASKVEPLFVNSLFRHPRVQGEMARRASGTSGSMKNIAKPKVLSMLVPFPPLESQQEFAHQVRFLRQLQVKARKSQKEEDDLFNSLVQCAFKGEL